MQTLVAFAAIIFGFFTASWAAVQIYNWIDGKRRRLHVTVAYGDYVVPPDILIIMDLMSRLQRPDSTKEVLLTDTLERDQAAVPVVDEVVERLNAAASAAMRRPIFDMPYTWVSFLLNNTGRHTLTRVTFRPQHNIIEAWVRKERKVHAVPASVPLVIEAIMPGEQIELTFSISGFLNDFSIRNILIHYEGGVPLRRYLLHRSTSDLVASPNFQSILMSAKLFAWVGLAILVVKGLALLIERIQ